MRLSSQRVRETPVRRFDIEVASAQTLYRIIFAVNRRTKTRLQIPETIQVIPDLGVGLHPRRPKRFKRFPVSGFARNDPGGAARALLTDVNGGRRRGRPL